MSKIKNLLEAIVYDLKNDDWSVIMKNKKKELSLYQKHMIDLFVHYRKNSLKIQGEDVEFYTIAKDFLNKAYKTEGFVNLPLNIIRSFFDIYEEIKRDFTFYSDSNTNPKKTLAQIESHLELLDDYANDLL